MKTIYKYPLQIADSQTISMPENPHILSVQVQNGTPCVWALVDTENSEEECVFCMFGTGQTIKEEEDMSLCHIGSFQLNEGRLVYHVFSRDVRFTIKGDVLRASLKRLDKKEVERIKQIRSNAHKA